MSENVHRNTVLIVDDQVQWRNLLSEVLADEFECTSVSSYEEARSALVSHRAPFHVIVADMNLDDAEIANREGLNLVRLAQSYGGYTNTIIITGYPSIETVRQAFVDLAVFDYIEKYPPGGLDPQVLIQNVHRAAESARIKRWENRVLLAEDNTDWLRRLSIALDQDGFIVENITTYREALERIKQTSYRLLITELVLENAPIQQGLRFIEQVRAFSPQTQVIIVSDAGTKETVRLAFAKLGVADFISKMPDGDFDMEGFREDVRQLYMPAHELFLVAEFEHELEGKALRLGQECVLVLSGREALLRPDRATSIRLPPVKDSIEMEVAVSVEGAQNVGITPTTNQRWVIPTTGKVKDLRFGLVLQNPGHFSVQVELFGEAGLWRHLELSLDVDGD
jgi:ActR/RegA family two-component response regulator